MQFPICAIFLCKKWIFSSDTYMIFIADLLSTNAFFHINNFLILCLILLKISLPYLSETVNSIWIINAFVTYLLENEEKNAFMNF